VKHVLKESHPTEKKMGMNYYCSTTKGIGGNIRQYPEDFIVEEILPDGRIIPIDDETFSFGEDIPGLFTEFVLIKRDYESHKAVINIAQTLKVKEDQIRLAGTKDKMAHTAQRATIWKVSPERLMALEIPKLSIRAPRKTIYQTFLGDLNGNNFTITIRNLEIDKKTISKRLENIYQEIDEFGGVANFFGHQRFGTRRPISHLIGKLLLQGKIKEAVTEYISKIYPDETEEVKHARKTFQETNDAEKTRELFPIRMVFERRMLKHLSRHSHDFLGAFNMLPKNLQKIFVHAYQSYIWNLGVSKKIAIFGNLKPQKEDLTKNNKLLFPIIGYKTELQDTEISNFMKKQLELDKLLLSDFEMRKIKSLKFPGATRKMVITPISKSWNIENNDDLNVKVKFPLGSGSYATVILREIMKTSPINY